MAAAKCTDPVVREDRAIYRAMKILERRMREAGPVLSDPATVTRWLRLHIGARDVEVFVGLFLDSQNQLIACEDLSVGTLNLADVYPREVVKSALRHGAAGVIFAHNHPSGVPEPSSADHQLTRRLKDALAPIDVRVLDHFVIGGIKEPMSFAKRGWL